MKRLLPNAFIATILCLQSPLSAETHLSLGEAPSHEVSPLLFGQFLERLPAKNPEQGPEAALTPGTSRLQPGVVEAMEALNAGVIRFPGGMVVAGLYDWTKMIDNSPFRDDPGRPEGYRFGLHEFFDLCAELESEPLLAVSFRPAVWGTKPGELPLSPEAFAAALVAYCNLPVGAPLPEGMHDWPALRAANGHPEPFGVRRFQIGNEWVAWLHATNKVREKIGLGTFPDDETLAAHVTERLLAMIEAMRAIDPEIEIIIDAVMWEGAHENWIRPILADERVREAADFATVHLYRPWGVEKFRKDGEAVAGDRLTPEEIWYAAVSAPNIDGAGRSVIKSNSWTLARELGWPITMTEWNWNGWGVERRGATLWPRALGVAGFLHAMLRESEHLHLATQSMMVGNHWMIAGVRVDPEAVEPPFVLPSGRMTGFYAEHSGDRFVPLEIDDAPVRPQPVSMGSLRATPKVALIDAVATEDDDAVYLHLINRDKDKAHPVTMDLGGRAFADEALIHRMIGRPWNPQRERFVSPGQFEESNRPLALAEDGPLSLELPAASVTIVELPKAVGAPSPAGTNQ
ncbi:MAG: hypothetical protein ACLFSZ_09620 [Puniceicoccaceae bacterium]